jgi:hypothetical protein
MLTKEFLCKWEVLGKRSPHSFTPPLSVVGVSNRYQVLEHLRKERFAIGTYNELKFKNIGLCKILRKFGENTYEIELPEDVGISTIFDIA